MNYGNYIVPDGDDSNSGRSLAKPLWAWPMEERIQTELGISVTEEIYNHKIKQPIPLTLP